MKKDIGGQLFAVLCIGMTMHFSCEFYDLDPVFWRYFMIIGAVIVIVYNLWHLFTRDYINNEKEKMIFLYEEFNDLIGIRVDCEESSEEIIYEVSGVKVEVPINLKNNNWGVEISMEEVDGSSEDPDVCYEILNISDVELEKLMTNKAGVKSIINSVNKIGVLGVLNPDVFISALSDSSSHK
tara:strand:- start:11 stop:556 length:546 start_codon:yes stop_codon:yes gene_type:complete